MLVVTIHPREELKDYAFLKKYGSRVAVCKGYELITLVEACDLYISQFSSTILMAMACGKPVVTFNFTDMVGPSHFAVIGGTLHVTSPEQLKDTVISALKNDKIRQQLYAEQQQVVSNYMKFDGKVVERFLSFIESEITKSRLLKPIRSSKETPDSSSHKLRKSTGYDCSHIHY